MVDARYQRLGIGRMAMQWVIDEARRMGLREVGLSHVMQPGHAGPFYQKLGFSYTGEMDEGEHKMVLRLVSGEASSTIDTNLVKHENSETPTS
jgi:predicted N-acetyltransferase YhbS